MTIIDHRILIPAAPDVVWDYISDITHNPDWQVDCREVIFLTSRREGPGVRWRYAAPNGHESVVAVTAWYNGLGYEYYLVDGVPYRENKGRIRLQEIPEGTIVQWTFTYELGGLLGGMRNALGTSRQVDQTIAESLKTLWQKIKQSGAAARPHEAKSLMRDAPNVDARSAYQPRHPSQADRFEGQKPELIPASQFQAEPPISEDDGQAISVIAEPPIKQDDTRPRPAVPAVPTIPSTPVVSAPTVPSVEAVPLDLDEEPEFLDRMVEPAIDLSRFEPPRDPSDTQPRRPLAPPEPVAAPVAQSDEPEFDESEFTASEFDEESSRELAAELDTDFASDDEPFRPPPPPTPQMGEETEPLGIPLPESLPIYRAPLVEPPETKSDQPAVMAFEVAPESQTQPQPSIEAEPDSEPVADEQMTEPATPVTELPPTPVIEPPPEPVAPPPAPPAPLPQPKADGEAKSIWEVFGLPRPSETQETAALKSEAAVSSVDAIAEPAAELVAASAAIPEPVAVSPSIMRESLPRGSSRVGLRIVLRRKLVRVRRP